MSSNKHGDRFVVRRGSNVAYGFVVHDRMRTAFEPWYADEFDAMMRCESLNCAYPDLPDDWVPTEEEQDNGH
jgi:hypothetical protein